MSSSSVAIPPPGSASASSPAASSAISPEVIQRLIDQAAGFNLYVVPDGGGSSSGNQATGFVLSEPMHRFNVVLQPPPSQAVQASNTVGEAIGRVDMRWFMIPDDFVARPDRQPPATRLDPSISQRFAMQETTFSFGNGQDGFRSFG